jgi:hypothetical protein
VKHTQGRAKDKDARADNAQSVINHAAPRARAPKVSLSFCNAGPHQIIGVVLSDGIARRGK